MSGLLNNSQSGSTPTPISGKRMTEEHPLQQPKKIQSVPQRPNWLPKGWIFEYKVRTSGVSVGSYDRYYIEPLSRHRFKSKKQVEYFLETGSRKLRASEAAAADNDDNEHGEQVGWAFDPKLVPEHVRWSLADSKMDSWDAFLGPVIVNQPTTEIWKDRLLTKTK